MYRAYPSPDIPPQDVYRSVKKGSPCSITERRVPELIPVFGSQPAGDVVGCQFCCLANRGTVGEGSGFKSQSRRCRVTVLGKLFSQMKTNFWIGLRLGSGTQGGSVAE